MNPQPTVEELRQTAEAFVAISDGPLEQFDQLCHVALTRWADDIERKQQHISHFMRKKAALAKEDCK